MTSLSLLLPLEVEEVVEEKVEGWCDLTHSFPSFGEGGGGGEGVGLV